MLPQSSIPPKGPIPAHAGEPGRPHPTTGSKVAYPRACGGTLLHHFGSAHGFQKALIARMAEWIVGTIKAAVLRSREAQDPAEVVELTFDTFGRDGASALASWMIRNGDEDALDPILTAIHDLVEELAQDHDHDVPIYVETLQRVLMALGDALLGGADGARPGVAARYRARTGAADAADRQASAGPIR